VDSTVTSHKKLVRDRIPEIIERSGKRPVVRVLGEEEYRQALRAKLVEEANEAAAAEEDALLSELADLAEVLDAALGAFGITPIELLARRSQRNAERGAFAKQVFLEQVEEWGEHSK
jgi:predicted house-cleaning noncanonical NTP pyrophosphatase (MazG superfamily)